MARKKGKNQEVELDEEELDLELDDLDLDMDDDLDLDDELDLDLDDEDEVEVEEEDEAEEEDEVEEPTPARRGGRRKAAATSKKTAPAKKTRKKAAPAVEEEEEEETSTALPEDLEDFELPESGMVNLQQKITLVRKRIHEQHPQLGMNGADTERIIRAIESAYAEMMAAGLEFNIGRNKVKQTRIRGRIFRNDAILGDTQVFIPEYTKASMTVNPPNRASYRGVIKGDKFVPGTMQNGKFVAEKSAAAVKEAQAAYEALTGATGAKATSKKKATTTKKRTTRTKK